MDSELVEVLYEDKIKKLLDKFLEPDFEINTDTYLNVLLSHLSGKEDKDLGETLINLPVFTEWLFRSLKLWENRHPLPPPNIIAFLFHIGSLLSKDEERFNKFNSSDFYSRLFTVIKMKDPVCSPLVKLAYIKLITSFLQHKSGTNWVIISSSWQEILQFCLAGQTIYIVREGHNFMYQILLATYRHDELHFNTVTNMILMVFTQIRTLDSSIIEVKNENFHKQLLPHLRLIGYILESHLESDAFVKRDYNLPLVFVKQLELEDNFWNSIIMGINIPDLVYEFNRVVILINFFKVAIECESPSYEYKENQKMISFIHRVFKRLILKFDTPNILKLGFLSQYYWRCITPRLEKVLQDRDKLPMVFDHQVIIFQIFPILAISYKYCDFNMEAATEMGSFRDDFITKIFTAWCEETIRLTYQFRKRLEEDGKNIFEYAQKSFMYIMKSRSYLHREAAILAFQFFIYILKDMTRVMIEKRETVDIFMKNTGYLVTHLDAITVFLQEYDITWRESIETITIMGILMKFINAAHWPPRVIVQVLKLVNLSIARFTTPNLALLVDRTSDSHLATLGPVLTGKFYDTSWEVRDSSLELLYTICVAAHTKFPSFQCLILEHDLPTLVVAMGMNDSESFVRASALKCLKEMIQVEEVWQTALKQQEIPEKMLQVLYNETEAIVRCEAASVICAIYEHQLFEDPLIDSIHQAMVYSATLDLHWEVKLKALYYWNNVLNNELSHQGMIDGAFPEVTFSCEDRKIVTLTDDEIRNRLKKVLVQLSNCGCLYVLVQAVQDECDIEVSKKGLEITNRLSALLEKYNVICTSINKPQVTQVIDKQPLLITSSVSLGVSDDVINEIVNSRDVQLLTHVYLENSNNMSSTKTFTMSDTKRLTPQDFLNFIKTDLNNLVDQRKKWLDNIDDLGSLLDDMLKNYDISDDTNAMDCY